MLFNEETVVASDGTRLFYRVAGEGPTTLLFLHGWAGSGSGPFWNRTLQYLDPIGLRLVLVDLRGHGPPYKRRQNTRFVSRSACAPVQGSWIVSTRQPREPLSWPARTIRC